MSTNSPDKEAYLQAENDLMKLADELIKEVGNQLKSSKQQKVQKQMEAIIFRMLKVMQVNGASEQSLQKAYPGLAEFAKYAIRSDYNHTTSKLENSQPSPAPAEEAPGLFLSEVTAQEVDWLWEKNIPLGKITILDGDPVWASPCSPSMLPLVSLQGVLCQMGHRAHEEALF